MVAPAVINDNPRMSEDNIDEEKFNHCIYKILKVFGDDGAEEPDDIGDDEWEEHPVIAALELEAVTTFSELLALGSDAILQLIVPAHDDGMAWIPDAKLLGSWTRKIRALVAYYHHESQKRNCPVDIRSASGVHFDQYRINEYAP
jgi:hypothetical protein